MKVAMMQPAFLPWQGFFELIAKADRFVFLDDFQFSVQSYHQRNRLFVNPGKADWYTVPIRKSLSFGEPLNLTQVAEDGSWRMKMWKRIRMNYAKAPHFGELSGPLQNWLLHPWGTLAAQNMEFIRWVCGLLRLAPEFRLSSSFPCTAQRSARVREILQWCEGQVYFSARGSFEYMLADGVFPMEGMEARFQDFQPKPYPQVGSPDSFVPCLAILDALLNVGPEATRQLVVGGTSHWWSWEEMKAVRAGREGIEEPSEQ
ncbi:MAG: WbqC family protein [Verrucomicrobia bacterium]|nr:WbqC family protein [Verrucomicrobiota bacterium]MBU1908463.1 WbqC family protein [Verrucomicrobiota bacterium]